MDRHQGPETIAGAALEQPTANPAPASPDPLAPDRSSHESPTGDRRNRTSRVGQRAVGLRFRLRTSGVEPILRLTGWALRAGLGWILIQTVGVFLPTHSRDRLHRDYAIRTSARAAHLLGTLKGAFAKAGQFAAIRQDLLPPPASRALASLRDRVPPLPLSELAPWISSELGMPIDRAFTRFDPDPIGAASIAQVHRARLADGTEVVVKIQYPWIEAALERDLQILGMLVRVLIRVSGRSPTRFDFDRLFGEFAAGLEGELDFIQEARTAAEIANNLASVPGVVVPRIRTERSSRRVLTMAFHPCVGLGDHEGLAALGAPADRIVEILARAYAKQVFVDGLFHADPHPGNLFVLETDDVRENPQVLFVDFGLCRRLSPELRQAMREGIYAVLQRDADTLVARMNDMGMIAPGAESGVRDAVATMFEHLSRTGDGMGMLGASAGSILALKDEAKQLLRATPGLRLPNDLVLYARTLSYLFALGESLDADVDLMKISIPYLLRFLAERE